MPEPTLESTLEGLIRRVVRAELAALNGLANGKDPQEPLLTVEQLADRLQCPVSYLHELSRHGRLPRYKAGKRYVYRLSEVLPVLKEQQPS